MSLIYVWLAGRKSFSFPEGLVIEIIEFQDGFCKIHAFVNNEPHSSELIWLKEDFDVERSGDDVIFTYPKKVK